MNYAQEKVKPYTKEGHKAEQIEEMFDHIAPDYDKLNKTMSAGLDKKWRQLAIDKLKRYNPQNMMDVATGTGDFAILACQELKPQRLIGTDISEGMMNVAKGKVAKLGLSERISFAKEDSTNLSFDDNTFDAITVAFGVRNFEDLDKGLSELHRVLLPGGHLVILELSQPEKLFYKLGYNIYSKLFIPLMGKLMSTDAKAYTYLPKSIAAFPQGEVMKGILLKAGFKTVEFKRLTMGVCTLYIAEK